MFKNSWNIIQRSQKVIRRWNALNFLNRIVISEMKVRLINEQMEFIDQHEKNVNFLVHEKV